MGGSARETEDGPLACSEFDERLLAQSADRLAAMPARLDDPGRPEATQMPGNQRLREADMGDQLCDGRLADGEPPDDAQSVHVCHDLVEGTQLTKLFRLGDGRGDRAADPGG